MKKLALLLGIFLTLVCIGSASAFTFVSDNFNDNIFNTSMWVKEWASAPNAWGGIAESGGKLGVYSDTGQYDARNLINVSGDFTIITWVSNTVWNYVGGQAIIDIIKTTAPTNGSGNRAMVSLKKTGSPATVRFVYTDNMSTEWTSTMDAYSTSEAKKYMRVDRIGNKIYIYKSTDGIFWYLMFIDTGGSSGIGTSDVNIALSSNYFFTGSGFPSDTMNFDDFTVYRDCPDNLCYSYPTPWDGYVAPSPLKVNVTYTGSLSSCDVTVDSVNYSMSVSGINAYREVTGLSDGYHVYNVTCSGVGSIASRTVYVNFRNCSNCSDCQNLLPTVSDGGGLKLNASVTNQAGNCITFPVYLVNATFDCNGYTLDGDLSGNDAGFAWTSTNFLMNVNNTVKNCIVQEFNRGVWFTGSGGMVINCSLFHNDGGGQTGSGTFDVPRVIDSNITQSDMGISGASFVYNVSLMYNTFGMQNPINCNISKSRFIQNTNMGIYFLESGSNNIINDSYITGNPNFGVYFQNNGATIPQNNLFYNNFFNNTRNVGFQSTSYTYLEKWNITRMSGTNILGYDGISGNYWATPTGTGFSENCSNVDAYPYYCDGAYTVNVTGNNYDYSPLTGDVVPPSSSFISQSPNDVDNFNVFGNSVNVTYSLTDRSGLNVSSVKFYFKTNSTSDCWYFINGTSYCGFNQGASMSNSSDVWTFRVFDNQVYPAIYNANETVVESTSHSSYIISGHDSYVKIRFFNVSTSKQYSIFEVMLNDSGSATASGMFYCNSSYSTGDPALSDYCANFYNLQGDVAFNHTHGSYSSHMVIPFAINLTTGKVGNVTVTSLSYFLLRGNTSDWHAYYVNSDSDSVQTTTDAGGIWSDQDWTVDSHLHQYSDSDMLWYYVYSCDSIGNCGNSSFRNDLIQLYGLPPIASDVYSPEPTTVTIGTVVLIAYGESVSPNSYAVESYNVTLVNAVGNGFVEQIANNNYPNWTYDWESDVIGDFKIAVESCDNQSQCSLGYSEIFTVQNEFREPQGLGAMGYYGESIAGFFGYVTNPLIEFLLAMGIIGVILAIVYSIGQGVISRMNGGVAG